MPRNWLRATAKNDLVVQGNANDFFLKVSGLGGETDEVYILNDQNGGLLSNGKFTIPKGVTFDFGYMSLPKGTEIVNYQLDQNGNLRQNSLTNVTATLNDDVFYKVLFDIQTDYKNNSRFFREASAFDFCNGVIKTGQAWSAHGGCGTIMVSRLENQGDWKAKPQITIIKTSLSLVKEDGEGGEYFLIPMLLPEKQTVFWALKNTGATTVKQVLDRVWFGKIKKFLAAEQNNTFYHLILEAGYKSLSARGGSIEIDSIRRHDKYGFSYIMHDDWFSLERIKKDTDGQYIQLSW